MEKQVSGGTRKASWNVWWRLFRPFTLTAAVMPVLIGTFLAFANGYFRMDLFSAMFIASILIQSSTNMFNEYFDYKRGLDNKESVGIAGTIVRDGVHEQVVIRLGFFFYFLAFLLGLYICWQSSWWVALVGALSMAVGYLYTGGPIPLAYTPFGELVVSVFMGPVIVLLAYFIQVGSFNAQVVMASVPIALLVASILTANNIRDLDGDQERGRRTLAILLGRPVALRFLGALFGLTYMWTLLNVMLGQYPLWALLVLLSLPTAVKVIRDFRGKTKPLEMMPAMKATAQLHAQFGLLFSVSWFLSSWS